ncbi:MAG TPA: PfkB family carbohydrate kinase [Candidatus Acidoferrum sp.]|nr:PfkB family carbohydrate kinase [Candidatus Acidoferrum sp.]
MSKDQKSALNASADLAALAEIVGRFAGKRIVLFGDFVADEFQFGDISRVSREAPVLILRHRETQVVPGGGANAANNLAALGAKVYPLTVVGDDAIGDSLVRQFRDNGVDTSGVVRERRWHTPTKTRFLAGWTHTVSQQVLRVDREPGRAPQELTRARVAAKLRSRLQTADGLAVSDYGFGVASPGVVGKAVGALKSGAPVTLDARYGMETYAGSGITAATPNEAELEALYRTTIGRNVGELEKRGMATLRKMALQSLLVTRGKDGMALFERRPKSTTYIPVHGSDQAVDVTGAGDTVLAAYTLALACGAKPFDAAHIANIAGGLVVMKRGTAVVTRGELLAAIRGEVSGSAS